MKEKTLSAMVKTVLLIFLVLLTFSNAYGSGFGIFTQGASALGQAAAVVAHTDQPSAVFYNPALINDLPGTQIELGTTLTFPSRSFTSALDGTRSSTESDIFYPSTLFLTHAFNDRFSAGFGAFTPFGQGTRWDDNWEGRYITTNAEMETYTLNPAVSYRLTPRISIAAGLDFLWLKTTMEQKINTQAITGLPLADTGQKFSGDGNGVGYNLGIFINFTDSLSIGVSYRSEIEVDIKGDITFDRPTALLEGLLPNTAGNTEITLPQQVFAGISYRISERMMVEAGMRWEDWSSFNELKIDLNRPVLFQQTITQEKDWHDTYAFNIGARYLINENLALLGGYLYGNNAVPDHSFEPSVPDSDVHLFCAGIDVKYKQINVGLSYAYQLMEKRDKLNDVGALSGGTANGEYESDAHMLAVSLVYRF